MQQQQPQPGAAQPRRHRTSGAGAAAGEEKLHEATRGVYRDLPLAAQRSPPPFGAPPAPGGDSFHPPVYRGVHALAYPPAAPLGYDLGAGVFGLERRDMAALEPPHLQRKELSLPSALLGKGAAPAPFGVGAKPMPFGQSPVAPVENKPPLAITGYLEPYSHFFSSMAGADIVRELETALRNVCVAGDALDMEVFDHKFKIKCTFYSHGGSCKVPFVVRVFSVEDDERLAVEFQRRSGDAIQFRRLYRDCLKQLESVGVALRDAEDAATEAPAPLAWAEPPQLGADPVAEEHREQAVRVLVQTMQSDCVDVQSQAAGALADLAVDPAMAKALLSCGAVDAFVQAARSSHGDVHRCAVTALAHLTERRDASCAGVARRACELGGVASAARLCSSSGAVPHVQREAMRLIDNVVHSVGRDVFSWSDGDAVRQLLRDLGAYPPADRDARRRLTAVQQRLA